MTAVLFALAALCAGFVIGAAYEATRENGSQDLRAQLNEARR